MALKTLHCVGNLVFHINQTHLTDYCILTEEESFFRILSKYVCRIAFQLAKKNALKILLKRKRKHQEERG